MPPLSQIRLLSFLCFFLWGSGSLSAAVAWVGGSTSEFLFADSNYDFSGSPISAIDMDVDIQDNVSIADTVINTTDFTGGFGTYSIGNGFSTILDNTILVTNAAGGFASEGSGATGELNLTNSSFVSARFISLGLVVNVAGDSHLELTGPVNPINTSFGSARVNLEPGASLSFLSTGLFSIESNRIFVNGVSYSADPGVLNIVGRTATAIPEPSVLLLLLSILLALTFHRRKKVGDARVLSEKAQ